MADSKLVDLDEADAFAASKSGAIHSPSLTAAIALELTSPPARGCTKGSTQLHASALYLGLHIPKRYLIVAQRAGDVDIELYLRFSMSLDNFNYLASYNDHRTELAIITTDTVPPEVIYSDTTGSSLEREIENEMVHSQCSLPVRNLESGTKLVMAARDTGNEECLQMIIRTMASISENSDYLHEMSLDHHQAPDMASPPDSASTTNLPEGESGFDRPLDEMNDGEGGAPGIRRSASETDIWAGLEMLDIKDCKELASKNFTNENQTSGVRFGNLEDLAQSVPMLPYSEERAVPLLSISDDSMEPTSSSDEFSTFRDCSVDLQSLPATQDISTIQTLPSAFFSPQNYSTSWRLEQDTTGHDFGVRSEEQKLERDWEAKIGQWSAVSKPSKYADAKPSYMSAPRPSDDPRLSELGSNRSQELRRGGMVDRNIQRTTQRNKENHPIEPTSHAQHRGSGYGVFGQQSRGRANRGGPRGTRGEEEERSEEGSEVRRDERETIIEIVVGEV